eukprot:2614419-Lingulodinium_polyedra.AAC.1
MPQLRQAKRVQPLQVLLNLASPRSVVRCSTLHQGLQWPRGHVEKAAGIPQPRCTDEHRCGWLLHRFPNL